MRPGHVAEPQAVPLLLPNRISCRQRAIGLLTQRVADKDRIVQQVNNRKTFAFSEGKGDHTSISGKCDAFR